MKNCKLVLVILLMSTLLVSCKFGNVQAQTQSDNVKFVRGYSIKELSFKFVANDIEKIIDPNINCQYDKQIETIDADKSKIGEYNLLWGNYTYVCVVTSTLANAGRTYVPVMILQGFYISEIKKNGFIYINDKNYKQCDLKKYIIYEDDLIIVYDMRRLLSGMKIDEYLKDFESSDNRGLKCEWMSEIYDKLINKQKIIITAP